MSHTLEAAQAFSFTAQETTEGMTPQGHASVVRDRAVSVRRPDRMRFDVAGDGINLQLYYDGVDLTAVEERIYAVKHMPGGVDTVLDFAETEYQIKLVFSELIHGDPYAALVELADVIEYVGLEDLEGRQVHHLSLTGPDAEADLWIESEGAPLPARAVVRSTVLLGAPSNTVAFSDWDLEADLPDAMFSYVPSEGVHQVGLTELLLMR
jgi:hypothetical protein